MKITVNSLNIDDEIDCWCGFKALFHHSSRSCREDGKITVWYKCSNNHKTSVDINYKSTVKEPVKKKKKEKKDGKTKKTEVPT
jgi:hypothetical protein